MTTLGELCHIRIGKTPPRNLSVYWKGSHLWAKIKDLNDNVLTDTDERISDPAINLLNPPAETGTLLFSFKLTIGKMAFTSEPTWFNEAIAALSVRNPKQLDSKYLFYVLKTLAWNNSTDQAVRGLTLNKKKIQKICIPLPPIEEQLRVAQFLSAVDDKLNALRRKQSLMERYKKGLLQKLFSQEFRFRRDGGGRSFPAWESTCLGSVLREEKSRNKNIAIERVLSITNRSGFVLPEEQFSRRVASEITSNYKVVRKGQYGYNPSRLIVGSFARLDNFNEGVVSPMYVVFSIDASRIYSDYFLNWMDSNVAKQRIMKSIQGSVRNSVGFDALCNFPFQLPSMEEQRKIADFLSSVGMKIEAIRNQIEQFDRFKKGLLQQLFV